VRNLLELAAKEQISAVVAVKDLDAGGNLLFATSGGQVKKTPLEAYSRPKRGGIIALRLAEGDDLVGARLERLRGDIVLASAKGKAVRFPSKEVRAQGRAAAGVRGMRLRRGDAVVAMLVPAAGEDVLVVSEKGLGKRTPLRQYRKMHRGGSGVITLKTGGKTGAVVGAKAVAGDEDLVLITEKGVVNRVAVGDISKQGRSTQGVRVMKVGKGDRVAAAAVVSVESE
jgi:DNA gyrase subunit A